MESPENASDKSTNEKLNKAIIQVIIGYMGICLDTDDFTDEELQEMFELEAA